MSKTLVSLSSLLAALSCLGAYDLNNRALLPVKSLEPPRHEPIELVVDGVPRFAIVYDKNDRANSASAGRGVELLREAFERCVGKAPEVFGLDELEKADKYPFKIIVGPNELSKARGVDPFQLPPQGFEIKTCPDGVVIAGNDSALVKKGKKSPLDKDGPTRGTLWGVCDFTERFLGCRYYYPGEYGSLWPKVSNLTINPAHYTDYPRFANRDSCWISWTMSGKKNQARWEPLLGAYQPNKQTPDRGVSLADRWRLGRPIAFHPGHDPNPHRMLKWFPDKKDVIFFRSESGHLRYNDKQHIGNDFDLTNLKFADLIIEAMKKYYASEGREYNIWAYPPNDKFINFGQCDGEVPLADMLRNPTVQKLHLITKENIERGSPLSDVYGRFLQYLGNRMKEEFPGLKLAFMPYQGGTYAPLDKKRWALPDNITLRVCTHVFPRVALNKKKIAKTVENVKEWYEATGNTPVESLWLYHIPAATGSPFVRAIVAQFVGDSVKALGKYLGRTSLFFDQYGGLDWSYYYSEYCGTRAMWNPDFNVDAAIDEHWEPFYGAEAGKHLRAFHRLLKDSCIKYYVMAPDAPINPLYPPEVIDRLESLLRQAEKSVEPGSLEAKRLKLFSAPWAKAFEANRNRQNYVRPIYNVHQLTDDEQVKVDGEGTEPIWEKIAPVPMLDPKGSGDAPKTAASMKLAWNDNGVYGLAKMPYEPLADERSDVWSNDGWEIFLSPGLGREDFHHYVVDAAGQSRTGSRHFLPIATPYNGQWTSPGFKFAVKNNEDDGWTMEFFAPFEDMKVAAPKAYDCWTANLVHNKLSDPAEYTSSSMTLGNNHNIDMYGSIKFLGKGD